MTEFESFIKEKIKNDKNDLIIKNKYNNDTYDRALCIANRIDYHLTTYAHTKNSFVNNVRLFYYIHDKIEIHLMDASSTLSSNRTPPNDSFRHCYSNGKVSEVGKMVMKILKKRGYTNPRLFYRDDIPDFSSKFISLYLGIKKRFLFW